MKRTLSISFLTAAMCVLLLLKVMPHHHHGEAVCLEAAERCAHTEDGHQHVHCIADAEYVTCENHETHGKVYSCTQPHHFHFGPLSAIVPAFADAYAALFAATRYKYGIFISPDAHGLNCTPHGLRAPPAACLMQA